MSARHAGLEALRQTAWMPRFGRRGDDAFGVIRGGMTLLPGEDWPRCACGAPLTGLLELDLSRVPAAPLRSEALLQVFLCEANGGECAVLRQGLARLHGLSGEARQPPGPGTSRADAAFITGWSSHEELPWSPFFAPCAALSAELEADGLDYRTHVRELGLEARRGSKLGGYARSGSAHVERRQSELLFQMEQEPPFFPTPFLPQAALFVLGQGAALDVVLGK